MSNCRSCYTEDIDRKNTETSSYLYKRMQGKSVFWSKPICSILIYILQNEIKVAWAQKISISVLIQIYLFPSRNSFDQTK
jgi:hypothetical protein